MAGLRIFVSSTCYDLAEERSQIKTLIENLGHEPILSDYNDVHYGHYEHTHVSCIRQISNVDMVILLIGSRYGGIAVDKAIEEVDIPSIQKKINNIDIQKLIDEMKIRTDEDKKKEEDEKEKREKDPDNFKDEPFKARKFGFSITHYEILRAIQEDITIYAFVKDKIWNFNELYLENKTGIEKINIPGVKTHYAKYLFEFIEILKHRETGNSVFPYSDYMDIENVIKRQLAEKLRYLMHEQKAEQIQKNQQKNHIDSLTEKFNDLKTAILASMPPGDKKDLAKGVIRYRAIIDFLYFIVSKGANKDSRLITLESSLSLMDFLKNKLLITNIISVPSARLAQRSLFGDKLRYISPDTVFLVRDNDFFSLKSGEQFLDKIGNDWLEFIRLDQSLKGQIVESLVEARVESTDFDNIEYFNLKFDDYRGNWELPIFSDNDSYIRARSVLINGEIVNLPPARRIFSTSTQVSKKKNEK